MILKWPETAKPATVYNNYIIVEDLFPTLLDMAQVKDRQTIQEVDGVSFMHALKDSIPKNNNTRSLYWHYPHEWGVPGPGMGASSTIRKGDWKLIYFHADSRMELYNIKNDIGEYRNLANSNKSKVRELAGELEDYLTSIKAQMPTYKSTGEIVPMPYASLTAKGKK
jgi:arylsulfatase A-like enzyme